MCSPNTSSHPPISKKGKEMTAGRARASTKLGLNHRDWCSIAVISDSAGPYRWDPTAPGLPTLLHSLATLHPHPGDVASHVRGSSSTARAGDKPGSETAGHTFYSWTGASSASEGRNSPLFPLPIRASPFIITPKLLLIRTCSVQVPDPAQIYTRDRVCECSRELSCLFQV